MRKLALLALLFAGAAHADQTFCVGDFDGLRAALVAWTTAPDASTVTVDVAQGHYDLDNASARTLGLFQATHAASIVLRGGYSADCATRALDPRNTVIDGHDEANSGLNLFGIDGNATIEGLTFTRLANGVQMIHSGGTSAAAHQFRVAHSRIVGNTSQSIGYTFRLWGFGSSGGAALSVENSLIAKNRNDFYAWFTVLSTGGGGAITVSNSTIAANVTGSGVQLQHWNGPSNIDIRVIDTIAWHNGFGGAWRDLDVENAPEAPSISYTVASNIAGTYQPSATLSSADPRFLSASAGNFRLRPDSPALDAGAVSQPNGFPLQDLDGGARIVGAAIDPGAYEFVPGDLIFVDGLE